MAEASLTTFVMSEPLPWPDSSSAAEALGPLDDVALYENGRARPCAMRRIAAEGATIRLRNLPPSEAQVAIELATGQRVEGRVEWARGGEAGVRFARPIDMLALLNRKLVAQAPERRRMPRMEVRCDLILRWSGSLRAVALRNISAGGLQVEGDDLPPPDTFVTPGTEGLNLPAAVVVWKRGRLAGLELMEGLAWSSLMPWIRSRYRQGAGT